MKSTVIPDGKMPPAVRKKLNSAGRRGKAEVVMRVRFFETDYDGIPVPCSGDYFSGNNASEIVEKMKMNPFQGSMSVKDFIMDMLARTGIGNAGLPEDENFLAEWFIGLMVKNGYAEYTED